MRRYVEEEAEEGARTELADTQAAEAAAQTAGRLLEESATQRRANEAARLQREQDQTRKEEARGLTRELREARRERELCKVEARRTQVVIKQVSNRWRLALERLQHKVVRRCRLTMSKPVFKAPMVSALESTM